MTKHHNPDGRIREQDRPKTPESGQDFQREENRDEALKRHAPYEEQVSRVPRQ